jgi:transposase
MKGHTVRTPELVREAIALREQGLTHREIAARLGIARSTAAEWVNDPDREAHARRRRKYAGACTICGGPTDGSRGLGTASDVCMPCREWTRDAVLEAFNAFWAEHGRSPRVNDANTGGAGHQRLPRDNSVVRLFGSWNKALLAAGLPLNMDREDSTRRDVERLYQDGLSPAEIADRYGWTPGNVYQRLQRAGVLPEPTPAVRWDRARIVAAAVEWTRDHGRPPSSAAWTLAGDRHPTYMTVRAHFGSWSAFLDAVDAAMNERRAA